MNLQALLDSVTARSVIRYTVELAPVNADGIVCPPTYTPPKGQQVPYMAFRSAWVDGAARDVVVLDSPQSQSNRIELALLQAHRAGRVHYPDITIAFPQGFGEPLYSVLQLSHRIYDAVLRASTWNGKPFFASAIGESLLKARPAMATALLKHAPVTLYLGAWDSNGGSGPQAAKIPRLLTSEIIGLDAKPADVSATKFDPMDIRANVAELLPTNDPLQRFSIKGEKGKDKGKRPSEYGFGNVPSTAVPRAAVISGGVQTSVLSCSGLRHLSFPRDEGSTSAERDRAGRALLAAQALYGLVAQNEAGYLLRSRCELIPRDAGRLDLVGRTLQDVQRTELGLGDAEALLKDAAAYARDFGLAMRTDTIELQADERLQTLVQRSRDAAARGETGDDA